MSSRSVEKFGAAVFSLLMVTSMFVGVVALGAGTASAAGNTSGFGAPLPAGTVTDNTPSSVAVPGATSPAGGVNVGDVVYGTSGNVTNVTVNLTGGDEGAVAPSAIDTVNVELLNASSVIAEQTRSYGSHNTTVGFGSTVTNVDQIRIRANLSTGAAEGQTIDTAFYVETNPTGFVNTVNNTTISTNQNGFISGRVSDQNNNDIPNAKIIATRDSDGYQATTTTNSEGDYTIELPPGTYTITANKSGFDVVQPKVRDLGPNETLTANIVLEAIFFADDLIAGNERGDDLFATGFVDENITVPVTVFDQEGDPISGVDISVSGLANSPVTVEEIGPATNSDGETFVVVSSPEVITDESFTVTANDGSEPSDEVSVSFVQNGEGEIDGTILNTATTDPVENASVWTVLQGTFQRNSVTTTVSLDNTTLDSVRFNVTANSNVGGSSLNSVKVDVSGNSGDVGGVGVSDITELTLNGTDATFDIDDVSSSNNGETLTITLGGNVDISNNDLINVSISNVKNVSDGASIGVTINNNQNANPTVNRTAQGGIVVNDSDGVIYVRLVDNETGAILDALDADYRIQTPDEPGTGVRALGAINTSEATEGEGYAIVDTNGDGTVKFTHTRLQDRDYYAQVSLNAPENSDIDEIGDETNPAEAFLNLSALGEVGVPINSSDRAFQPSANLTLEATEKRANNSSANLVDAPEFVNTFGFDTGGTNVNGQFKLSKLFTDFQDGRYYTVIADKGGFATEFGEVFVTEDGAEFTQSPFQGLNLEPIPVDPDAVNITQAATHPKEPFDPALLDPFEEVNERPGDSDFQTIARDNQTYDVIRLDTSDPEGDARAEVRVELEEYDGEPNLTGTFVGVVGGSIADPLPGNEDAVIVDTGGANSQFGEGTAYLIYLPDPSDDETVDVRKTAELVNDASATDFSNATFVGTILLNETGSLSGIVTNNENDPLPSTTVYTEEFTVSGQQFTLTPVGGDSVLAGADSPLDVLNATWEISAVGSSESFEVKGYNLTTDTIDNRFDVESSLGVEASDGLKRFDISFVSLEGAAEDDGLTLLTFSSEAASGQYTLPRVPADRNAGLVSERDGGFGATYQDVRAVQIQPEDNIEDGRGDSVAEGVQVGQTQEANIVLPFVEPLGADLSIVEPADGSTVSQGQQLDVVVNLENENVVTSIDRTVTISLDGTELGTTDVTLEAGETVNETVTVTVPADADTGDATLVAETGVAGEIDQVTVTIQNASESSLAAQYDTNDDGVIQSGEVLAVIAAFNDGQIDDSGVVLAVINEFNEDQQWSDV